MSLIKVRDLTFAYDGGEPIFDGASFDIDTDWRLGFTGRNGRGKTTFLNLLMGKYEYGGTISSSVGFEYFPFDTRDYGASASDVAEASSGGAEYWRIVRELSLLGIDEAALCRPFSTLSPGERTKVMLAAMFLRDDSFFLIDEPTNHLDMDGRRAVSRYLSKKRGFIVVSHDRTFLDGCVDHILSINRATIDVVRGNFSTWLENKERRDSFELSENRKLKSEIKRLRATVAEKSDWADRAERRKTGSEPIGTDNKIGRRPIQAAKSKKLQKRAHAIEARAERAVEEKKLLLRDIDEAEDLKITQPEYKTRRLITLKDVSVDYGGNTVCRGVGFELNVGDRIALLGGNGAGKSSIIKLICGDGIHHTGTVSVGAGVQISYVPQDLSGLSGSLYDYAAERSVDVSLFFAILRKLDFSRAQFDIPMERFSAGQKKKAAVARSLSERAHVHIWDEPMNYIDVISRMQIEELILRYSPTLLFVEHDEAFCKKTATSTVVIGK